MAAAIRASVWKFAASAALHAVPRARRAMHLPYVSVAKNVVVVNDLYINSILNLYHIQIICIY